MRILFLALLILPSSAAAPARRDLDVGVPPGTPLEWTKELKPPIPTLYRGSVPTATASGDVLEGGTIALGVDFGSASALGVGRITTRDLPSHLPWTVPTATGDDRVPTPSGTITWAYPPTVTSMQWWWCLAPFLRYGLHPQLVSEGETGALLLEIGEPSRLAAEAAAGHFGADIVAMIKRDVTPVPAKAPEPPQMDSALQQMFADLAARELTSEYPYGLNPYFAQRTLSLGDQAFPAVLACAKSDHVFLRRNAMAVLAQYGRAEGLAYLREVAANSKDAVARTRAILGLARRRDKDIVPLLVKMLDDADKFKRALAAYALGVSSRPEGGEALLKKASVSVGDGDLLMSLLPALGRVRMNSDKFTASLRNLAAAVARTSYDMGSALPPDVPDPKNLRRDILVEFAQLALAAQGDEAAIKEVLAKKDGFKTATQYLAVEVLGWLGEDGAKSLQAIVQNGRMEPVIRAQALARILTLVPNTKFAVEVASNEAMPPGVRGIALTMLPAYDPTGARNCAKTIIEAYLKGRYRTPAEAYLVLTSLQALGRTGDSDIDVLLQVAEVAAGQRRRTAPASKRPPSPMDLYQTEVEIVIDVPLLETALIELGRTRSKRAGEALAMVLADAGADARAEAAFSLGAVAGKAALVALVGGLQDKDGWVRWASYVALHGLTGKEFFCDWIGGGASTRSEFVKKWKDLVAP